ncbi:MAG: hypothetical protein OEW87_13690 [Flavobacteriaceae bacterium]|nr:hypothetical protein [Flavobacteriaceae bacterium]
MRTVRTYVLSLFVVGLFLATGTVSLVLAGKSEPPMGTARNVGPATITTITYDVDGNRTLSGVCKGQPFTLGFGQDANYKALDFPDSFLDFTQRFELGVPQALADCYKVGSGEALELSISAAHGFNPIFDATGSQVGLTVEAVWLERIPE